MTNTQSKSRKLLLAGLSAFALLGAGIGATQALAMPHDGNGWTAERMEHRTDRMLKQVDATPDQLAKVHAIIEAAAKDVGPMKASMSGTHDKMRALLSAATIDTAAIDALRAQRATTMDQISVRMTKALEDAANVLTPDQRVKLAAIDTAHGEHGGHHHHHH